MFAETEDFDPPTPLAPRNDKVRSQAPDVLPHVVWCKFINERVEIARYYDQQEIDIFVAMFNQCLHSGIGSKKRQRTVRYGACLFRFLSSALRLLQEENIQNIPARNALRERVYAAAMDYFAGPLDFPSDFKQELRDDIKILIRFWVLLHTDKRYLQFETPDTLDSTWLKPLFCDCFVPFKRAPAHSHAMDFQPVLGHKGVPCLNYTLRADETMIRSASNYLEDTSFWIIDNTPLKFLRKRRS